MTGTNPIKRDNYFPGPMSCFCNYVVLYFLGGKCAKKEKKNGKTAPNTTLNGKGTFLKADRLSLDGNSIA